MSKKLADGWYDYENCNEPNHRHFCEVLGGERRRSFCWRNGSPVFWHTSNVGGYIRGGYIREPHPATIVNEGTDFAAIVFNGGIYLLPKEPK